MEINAEPADSYVLARTSEEYRRLRLQALTWEKATGAILDETGLREGMRCLDVGCGSGDVMRLMGEKVGETGSVTGVDIDGKLGRESLEVLKASGKCNFEFIQDDVAGADDISREKYDLTYARFLLFHMKDPDFVLRKMYEWTRPGGYLVVQDYDFSTFEVYPRIDILEEGLKAFSTLMEKGGKDIRIGRKLPHHFLSAGIGPADNIRLDGIISTLAEAEWWLRDSYQSILPVALKAGFTTEEKSKALLQTLSDLANKESHYFTWPLLVGAWKRKADR